MKNLLETLVPRLFVLEDEIKFKGQAMMAEISVLATGNGLTQAGVDAAVAKYDVTALDAELADVRSALRAWCEENAA